MSRGTPIARGVTRRSVLRLAGAAAVSGGVLAEAMQATDAFAAPGQELTGTWMSGVAALGSRLVVYNADGSSVATQAEPRTPQMGCWVRTGDRQFLIRSLSYRLDSDGGMLGSYDVRLDVTVDPSGMGYAGQIVQREYDVAGTLVNTVDSTVQATRLVPLPL